MGCLRGRVNKALHEAAGCTIRRRLRLRKKMWMSEETWDMIKKRGEAKVRSEVHFVSDEDFELARTKYLSFDSEVKRLTERDKRSVNGKVAETEKLIKMMVRVQG